MDERTDTERLDWMARVGADFCYTTNLCYHWRDEEDGAKGIGFLGGDPQPHTKIGCRVPSRHLYRWHVFDGADVREAIDAAMDGIAAADAALAAEFGVTEQDGADAD